MDAKANYHEAGKLNEQARSIIDAWQGKEMPAEVETQVNTLLDASADLLKKTRAYEEQQERLAANEALLARPDSRKALPVAPAPAPGQGGPATLSHKDAFERYLHTGHGRELAAEVKAALNETTGNQGGYFVPVEYSQELVTALVENSIVRAAGARSIPMNSQTLKVASLTNTTAAVLTSEAAAYDEKEPTAGEVTFTAYKYTRIAKASQEIMDDSRYPIWETIILPDVTQAFALAENDAFTTGSGSSQPQGVVTGATQGVVAASASAVTGDEVIALYHALNYLYRGRAKWMLNDAVILAIRKLKDSYGQYLWQPGLQAGQPDMLLGKPVVTNNHMATFAINAKTILFGDFGYYWIGDRNGSGLEVQVLNELYAANGQVGFACHKRVDGHVMLAAAFQYLQMAAA